LRSRDRHQRNRPGIRIVQLFTVFLDDLGQELLARQAAVE